MHPAMIRPLRRRPSTCQALTLTCALGLTCAALAPVRLEAAMITLTAKSGGFDIEGELKSFDGSTYVIETAAGPMTLPAAAYACTSDGCPKAAVTATTPAAAASEAASRIAIDGSSTIGRELMPDLVRAFAAARRQPTEDLVGPKANETEYNLRAAEGSAQTSIALAAHGTKSGIAALTRGETTFAMVDRDMTSEELEQITAGQGQPPRTFVLGIDGITVVAGANVDAKSLTASQLAKIFAGQIKDWSELGLKAGPITVYAPEAGQGTRDVFVAAVLKPYGMALSPNAVIGSAHAERVRQLSRDPFGITFVSLSAVDNARTLDITTTCGLVARPTAFAIKAEEFPLSRRLQLFANAAALDATAEAFAKFATSNAGQKVVALHGFVDQSIEAVPFAHEVGRMRAALRSNASPAEVTARNQLLADAQGFKRLSVTVRFATSTSAVDPRSRQELERLSDALKTPTYQGKTVLLAGFTDPIGTVAINQALSRKRADQVRSVILARSEGAIKAEQVLARGYGPVAPVACNDTPEGLNRNRRVEVWVKE
jgi:phosphate transport system substrate-binding protein